MSRKEPIENRVATAAEAALAARTYVAPVDVLIGVGWLAPSHLDAWRQGRLDCLERLAQVDAEQMARSSATSTAGHAAVG